MKRRLLDGVQMVVLPHACVGHAFHFMHVISDVYPFFSTVYGNGTRLAITLLLFLFRSFLRSRDIHSDSPFLGRAGVVERYLHTRFGKTLYPRRGAV